MAFDPMMASRWTLLMAIAWVAWRDVEAVTRMSANGRSATTYNRRTKVAAATAELHGTEAIRYDPESSPLPSFLSLVVEHRFRDGGHSERLGQAQDHVWRALGDGQVVATDDHGEPIPAAKWHHLRAMAGGSGNALELDSEAGAVAYREVTLARTDVVRKWPPAGSNPEPAIGTAKKRPWRWEAIDKAIAAEWPEGFPTAFLGGPKARDKAIIQAARRATGDARLEISRDTINRYFKELNSAPLRK